MKNSRGDVVWSKTVVLTIVILVLVVGAIFLFKADINKYLRNLPGYTYPEDDSLIDVDGSGSVAKPPCPYAVALIKETDIFLCKNGEPSDCGDKLPLSFTWTNKPIEGDITLTKGRDSLIGTINNNKVKLKQEALTSDKSLNKKLINAKITISFLKNLDGSELKTQGFLCREKSVEQELKDAELNRLSRDGVDFSQVNPDSAPDMDQVFSNLVTAQIACGYYATHTPGFQDFQTIFVKYKNSEGNILRVTCFQAIDTETQ